MIDIKGNSIDEKSLLKNIKANETFRLVKRKLKKLNITLEKLYICDERLVSVFSHKGTDGGAIYIDGFKDDNIHASIRLIYPRQNVSWYNDSISAKKYIKLLNDYMKVYQFLEELDFSNCYKVFEKSDPNLKNGTFSFSESFYESIIVEKIIKKLQEIYDTEHVYGKGFKTDDRIVVFTENIKYAKDHWGPAYYDYHVFDIDGTYVKTKSNVVTGDSYNHFFIDNILSDNGKMTEIILRSCILSGHKCDDTYYACAKIYDDGITAVSNFIFSDRASESGSVSYNDDFRANGFTYRTAKDGEIGKENAIKIARKEI